MQHTRSSDALPTASIIRWCPEATTQDVGSQTPPGRVGQPAQIHHRLVRISGFTTPRPRRPTRHPILSYYSTSDKTTASALTHDRHRLPFGAPTTCAPLNS